MKTFSEEFEAWARGYNLNVSIGGFEVKDLCWAAWSEGANREVNRKLVANPIMTLSIMDRKVDLVHKEVLEDSRTKFNKHADRLLDIEQSIRLLNEELAEVRELALSKGSSDA